MAVLVVLEVLVLPAVLVLLMLLLLLAPAGTWLSRYVTAGSAAAALPCPAVVPLLWRSLLARHSSRVLVPSTSYNIC